MLDGRYIFIWIVILKQRGKIVFASGWTNHIFFSWFRTTYTSPVKLRKLWKCVRNCELLSKSVLQCIRIYISFYCEIYSDVWYAISNVSAIYGYVIKTLDKLWTCNNKGSNVIDIFRLLINYFDWVYLDSYLSHRHKQRQIQLCIMEHLRWRSRIMKFVISNQTTRSSGAADNIFLIERV